MKKIRQATIYVLIAAAIILIGYDIYAIVMGGVEATISRVILKASQKMPVLPFSFGFLMGHLFWPQPSYIKSDDYKSGDSKDSK